VPAYVLLTPEQLALEAAADELLRHAVPDPERPVYTERQLARRGRRLVSSDVLAEMATAPPQPLRDELRFLAAVSHLSAEQRGCLNLWLDGWSQREIAEAYGVCQQRISQRLRVALRICYDATPISFRRFSYHTIYRPPRRRKQIAWARRCIRCGEEYPAGIGCGRYCSTACRHAAEHTRG
jgi:hypothetical protein